MELTQTQIKNGWKVVKLGEVFEYTADNRGRNPGYYSDSGIPVIDNFMITGQKHIELSTSKRFIDSATYSSFIRKEIKNKDILMTLVGNGYGNVAIAPLQKSAIIQNTIGLRVGVNDSQDYLFYVLGHIKSDILKLDRGSAQPSVKVGDLLDLSVSLPPLPTQEKIAGVLSTYDDLTENNDRRIKVLEAMAQKLYTEWFVHFKFPGYEKVKMVDSCHPDFGLVPEGVEMVVHIDRIAGLDISVVYPIMMNKIYALLDEYNMPYVRRFMEVIDQERMKTGLI